jgi:hypothetical protein
MPIRQNPNRFRMQQWAFLFFINLILLTASSAQTVVSCPDSKGHQRAHRIDGYFVRLSPGEKDSAGDRCRGSVARPGTRPVVFARGWRLWIDDISGSDINGGGSPDAVFGAFTGEGNCCFDYTIVKLARRPELVRKIHNQLPVHFQKENDGSVTIRAGDGSFDLFLLPHSEAVIPEVIMRLQGSKLLNISSEFQQEYDGKIASARNELTPAALAKFRSSDFHKSLYSDQAETLERVLTIVLNYLYSGRENDAWQALDEIWPPTDKDRIHSLIQERRKRGLLAQISKP